MSISLIRDTIFLPLILPSSKTFPISHRIPFLLKHLHLHPKFPSTSTSSLLHPSCFFVIIATLTMPTSLAHLRGLLDYTTTPGIYPKFSIVDSSNSSTNLLITRCSMAKSTLPKDPLCNDLHLPTILRKGTHACTNTHSHFYPMTAFHTHVSPLTLLNPLSHCPMHIIKLFKPHSRKW